MKPLIVILIFCFSAGVCFAQKKRNVQYELPYRNIDSLSTLFIDSIKSRGISNIIEYRKTCRQCELGAPEFDYIIWMDSNKYFIKKMNSYINYYQHGFYSDIESPMAFFNDNKDTITYELLADPRGRVDYWITTINIYSNEKKYTKRFNNGQIKSVNSSRKLFFFLTLIQSLVLRADEIY